MSEIEMFRQLTQVGSGVLGLCFPVPTGEEAGATRTFSVPQFVQTGVCPAEGAEAVGAGIVNHP